MRPSWWPRAKGTPQVTPEVAPAPTQPTEEPQETAFQNWARRLVIGHRDVVRQILADDAAREREKFQVEREDIRAQSAERRSRENILLNIREQARVGQEKEGREREERLALSRLLGQVKTGTPPGEPPVAPEDIFQFKGGREAYQAEFPKPSSPDVFQDKQGNIRSRRTPGQVLEPAPPREKFTPPEGYVPSYIETPEGEVRTHYTLPQAPYGLDAIAQGMTNPQTGKSYQRYIELPPDRKKEARDEAARLQGQFAGTRETGRYTSELSQAIGKEASQFIHPKTWASPPSSMPRGKVFDDYVHVAGGQDPSRGVLTVVDLFRKAVEIVTRRDDLYFPFKDSLAAGSRARIGSELRWKRGEIIKDPDVGVLRGLEAAIPQMVKGFGDVGNISFSEREMTTEAAGLQGPDSKEGALHRIKSLLEMLNAGVSRLRLDPREVPGLTAALKKFPWPPPEGPESVDIDGITFKRRPRKSP